MTSVAMPITTSSAPRSVIHMKGSPGPVKARLPDEALTGWAAPVAGSGPLEPLGDVALVDPVGAVALPGDAVVEVGEPPVVAVLVAVVVESPVIGEGDVVVVEELVAVGVPGGEVVVHELSPQDEAISGETGPPLGRLVVMPLGAESFGYAVQVSASVLPDAVTVSWAVESWVKVMGPPLAVNGPTVLGVAGSNNCRPVGGTGVGIGTSKLMVPLGTCAGVAPVASTLTFAVPTMPGFPRAAAASTIWLGSARVVW
jgi:hypothetical protein